MKMIVTIIPFKFESNPVILVDYDIKSELEVVYAEIIDVKIGEFLKSFLIDLVV